MVTTDLLNQERFGFIHQINKHMYLFKNDLEFNLKKFCVCVWGGGGLEISTKIRLLLNVCNHVCMVCDYLPCFMGPKSLKDVLKGTKWGRV